MRGVMVGLLALGLAACATNRSALVDDGASSGACRAVVSATGPVPAHELARHLGMTYHDADSHVLLADAVSRVRIWKDSNELSISGESRRLGERTRRRGGTLLLPASTASYVTQRVGAERRSLARPTRRTPVRPVSTALAAPLPVAARTPKPAPACPPSVQPSPEPARPAADARWEPRGVASRPWRWIVLHHSADARGDLAKYDRIHRETNGWDECGYHFVIGNGSLSGNGEVEVGSRWRKQKHGAHCKTGDNCFNDYGIGICLVGDFETGGRPSRAQMDAVVRLCAWLMDRYDIPLENVVGHSDCKATACPGRNFPWGELRSRLRRPTL